MMSSEDLERLRIEYAERERRLVDSDIYLPFNKSALFTLQQRQRAELDFLRRQKLSNLIKSRIFKLDCGSSGVLLDYLIYGASPANIHGCVLQLFHIRDDYNILFPGLPAPYWKKYVSSIPASSSPFVPI